MPKELSNQSSVDQMVLDIRKGERREVAPGYPRTTAFSSPQEVAEYLNQPDDIDCLLCGRRLQSLSAHLAKIHRVSSDQYRERYGLPYRRGLTSAAVTSALQEVRSKDSTEVRRSRIARITSPDGRDALRKAAVAQRISGLKHMTTMAGLAAVDPANKRISPKSIAKVIDHMETGNTMLQTA